MRTSRARIAGGLAAPTEAVFLAGAPSATGTRGDHSRDGSPNGRGWRILRAITQEREERESRGADAPLAGRLSALPFSEGCKPGSRRPGRMESSDLNLRTKSLRLTAAVAAAVLGIALVLVVRLVAVADDPQLARQI